MSEFGVNKPDRSAEVPAKDSRKKLPPNTTPKPKQELEPAEQDITDIVDITEDMGLLDMQKRLEHLNNELWETKDKEKERRLLHEIAELKAKIFEK